jgi:hypothetical protein
MIGGRLLRDGSPLTMPKLTIQIALMEFHRIYNIVFIDTID